MTQTPVPDDLAVVAQRLTQTAADWRAEAQELRQELSQQTQYGHTNRRAIWGLVISIVMDVALSVVVAVLAVQAGNNSSATERNHDTQVATCEAANQSRRDNQALWNFFITLAVPDVSKAPPATQEAVAKLERKLDLTYAQRDCAKLGPNGAPTLAPSRTPVTSSPTHS